MEDAKGRSWGAGGHSSGNSSARGQVTTLGETALPKVTFVTYKIRGLALTHRLRDSRGSSFYR